MLRILTILVWLALGFSAQAQMLLSGSGPGSAGGCSGASCITFTVTGPTTGTAGSASTAFTVTLGTGSFNGSQTITIADGSQGGTITPSVGSPGTSSVVVTPANLATSFTFTYTAVVGGPVSLSFTNAQGWSNAGAKAYTGAVTYTASGPSTGTTGSASTNFTVSMPGSVHFNGAQTVTIADASGGGTFTPSVGSTGVSTVTVTPANNATSFTFTYNAVSDGAKTLTFTNAQSWTNPSPLTYTASSGAYTGPGNIVSGAKVWYGISCYTSTYSGNVADITDTATGNTTGTRLQCVSGVVTALVSGSACTFVTGNACSPLATTCAVSCNVQTLYDQSGLNLCVASTAPCNLGSLTNAARPLLNLTAIGGHPAINCTGSSVIDSRPFGAGIITTTAQPFTISAVAERLSGSAVDFPAILSTFSTVIGLFFDTHLLGNIIVYTGSSVTARGTAADNAAHAAQGIFNGASSILYIDGTQTTGLALGNTTAFPAAQMAICTTGSQFLTGYFGEAGLWPSGFTTQQQSDMNANQHTRWGF